MLGEATYNLIKPSCATPRNIDFVIFFNSIGIAFFILFFHFVLVFFFVDEEENKTVANKFNNAATVMTVLVKDTLASANHSTRTNSALSK